MSAGRPQPHFKGNSFTCPHCGAFAHMVWQRLYSEEATPEGTEFNQTWLYQSTCISCGADSLWIEDTADLFSEKIGTGEGKMIYPRKITAPPPHPDLPPSCLHDFEEARAIAAASPRGAAALLRLCIQKLCAALGQPGKKINDDIAALVQKGLPREIQQALDAVRVIGNEAVHPGTLTGADHAEHVDTLFELVNIIVEQLITQPNKIAAVYEKIPAEKRAAIEQRDKKSMPHS